MANKIPVGATIARTYGFAFGNAVNNLGAAWIPLAILFAGTYLMMPRYVAFLSQVLSMGGAAPGSAAATAQAQVIAAAAVAVAPAFLAFAALMIICLTAMNAGMTKEALGRRTGSPFVSNPFDGAFWRLLGAYLLFIAIYLVIYIASALVLGIGVGVMAGAAGAGNPAAAVGVALAIMVVMYGILIFFGVRLGFYLAPIAIAEQRISILRNWQLTGGNFWRIFVVLLAILLPFVVIEFVLGVVVAGNLATAVGTGVSGQDAGRNAIIGVLQLPVRYWYIYYPAAAVVSVLGYGLLNGAAAFAYRALAPDVSAQDVF